MINNSILKPSKAMAKNNRGIETGSKISDALVAATPTVIGLWDLEVTHTKQSPPEAAFYRPNAVQVDESIVGRDERTMVKAKDFAENGKYRCIVKLMARMEGHDANDPWMMGTGWLIEPDLIVTAGHMSFDWDHNFGFAKEIKAWIGYYGRDNVGDTSVQFRHGKTVSAPAEWIKAPHENYDVSFIKVDKPFTGVKAFTYIDTPAKGNLNLGIVGYPGDLRSPQDPAYGEHMYEMYLPTQFDLAASKKLLQYEIDTFGGNSGSPVIVKDDMKAIGVHVLGGNINSASVIGPLGNDFETYKGSFNAKPDPSFDVASKVPSRAKSFRVVTVPSSDSRHSKDNVASPQSGTPMKKEELNGIYKINGQESLTETAANESADLRLLLKSSVHTHTDPDQFLGSLQHLLEPEMVSAMTEVCNGAEGLVTALHFLWDHNKEASGNNEALLSTLAKHKSTVEHVGKEMYKNKSTIERVGEQAPILKILSYGMDAANELESATNESVLDHIANGLSVTLPIAGKELPKLGAIGRPIATIAASLIHISGAHAAASLSSTADPTDTAQEGEVVDESVPQGVSERAVLAETALHGIMHLSKGVLKQNQVFEKIHSIVKPLAPIVRRADPMVSSLIQPAITKVALGSLKTPSASSASADAATQDTPQVTVDAPSPTTGTESAPFTKIGTTVTFNTPDASTANGLSPDPVSGNDAASGDAQISALTQSLVAAHPHLAHVLPGLVERGMKVGDSAFAKATKLGLPLLLGDDKESEYHEQNAESAVPVSGLAQRALLAEAALQVLPQLPVEVVKTLEVPNLDSTLEAFETNSEGHDEADQSTTSQKVTAGAAFVGAAASTVSSIASSASAYYAHQDKKKDQEQKERELTAKHVDDYNAKIGANQTAVDKGRDPMYPNLRHHDKDGKLVVPATDKLHPGSPDHPNQTGALPQSPAQHSGRSSRNSPSPSGPPGGPPGPPPGGPGGAGPSTGAKSKTAQGKMPATTAPEPSTPAPKPKTTAPKPTTTGTKPTTTAPKPTTTAPKPTTTAPKPTTTAPKPSTTAPKPLTVQSKPLPTTKVPVPTHPATTPPHTTTSPTHSTVVSPHPSTAPSPEPEPHATGPVVHPLSHIPAPTHTPDPEHPRSASPTPSHPASTTTVDKPKTPSYAKPTASSAGHTTPKVTPKATVAKKGSKKAEGLLDEDAEAEGAIAEEWLTGFVGGEEDEEY